jgi:hypothetical protein
MSVIQVVIVFATETQRLEVAPDQLLHMLWSLCFF